MTRRLLRATLLAGCLALAAAGPSSGHGASEGLHLHLEPETARPGETVSIEVDGAEPLRLVVAGIVDGPWTERTPAAPTRSVQLTLTIPEGEERKALSIHAEAETAEGAVVRASAILVVSGDPVPATEPGHRFH